MIVGVNNRQYLVEKKKKMFSIESPVNFRIKTITRGVFKYKTPITTRQPGR